MKVCTYREHFSVLVVDDEKSVRAQAARILTNAGSLVLQATGGLDALELMETVVPDVLVTDIAMPGLDGLKLASEARRIRGRMPVVFMTSFANSSSSAYARRLGPVVEKPLREPALIHAVGAAVEGRRHRASVQSAMA